MLRSRRRLEIALLLGAALLLPTRDISAQSPAKAPATTSQRSKRRATKPAPIADAPQAQAPPPTLEQLPPEPPQVTYRDGQLTISSTNATLAQVLHSVQMQTGATIEIPSGAGSERVVATLGPGKPQNVLASLLNGSKFNYLILGVPDTPGSVQKVILLSKSSSNTTGGAPVNTAQGGFRPPSPQPAVEQPEDEYPQNEPEVENQNQLQPGTPGSENLQPDQIQQGNRTPEQMLQELQRMQQQQQQMQQQLNPANQQPFGQPAAPQNQQQPQAPFPGQPQRPE
jgi:hypothetical protein